MVGQRQELARDWLEADRLNWLVDGLGATDTEPIRCTAQIRYRHEAAAASVEVTARDRVRVTFDEPQFGVAPGQAVVFYDGDVVIGGGWID